MANRGYDVVVDVDAEVISYLFFILYFLYAFFILTIHRETSGIPTSKKTLNSTPLVRPSTHLGRGLELS